MKVYGNPGIVTNYTPTGDGSSAQTLISFDNLLEQSTQSGMLPTTILSDTEQTRDGSSRTMLKVQTRIPKALLYHAIGSSMLPGLQRNVTPQFTKDILPSVHLVLVNYPELVRLATSHTAGGAADKLDDDGIGRLIAFQIRQLVALAFGRSLPDDWQTVPVNGALLRGMLGLEPLDVVGGSYGTAEAINA